MIRLNLPDVNFAEVIGVCESGMKQTHLKDKLMAAEKELLAFGVSYECAGNDGNLFRLPSFPAVRGQDRLVADPLTRDDLLRIYDGYFVPSHKPARRVYDRLMVAAKEKCPFCGGIGRPRNLDHYLPKTHFPQFSVLPLNLIPSCRDCNMDGKQSQYANNANEQLIHPFLDNERFFKEQWIEATFEPALGKFGVVVYSAAPPHSWSTVDKERVRKHFKDFDLGKRFSIKAAEALPSLLEQIARLKDMHIEANKIREVLLRPVVEKAASVNDWRRVMYQAISVSL